MQLVIFVSVCGLCRPRAAAHRDASTTPSVAGNKAKKKEVSWVRDALRFLGARSCFEGQSNGVKSPRVATRNVTRSHGNEPVAQAPRIFPPPSPIPPRFPPLFRFSAISGWASREFSHFSAFQHRNLLLLLFVPMRNALYPTFCTFDMTSINLRIALWWPRCIIVSHLYVILFVIEISILNVNFIHVKPY